MSIVVNWDDEAQTIVRWDFLGTWTWEEVYDAVKRSTAMRAGVEHNTSLILNVAHSAMLPMGAITHTRNALRAMPEKREMTVLVGGNSFFRVMANAFRSIYKDLGAKFFLADTIDEARAMIWDKRTAARQT